MAINNQAIQLAIITTVQDSGELMTPEIVEAVAGLYDTDDATETRKLTVAIERQVIALDRDGKLTRRNAESGWQITATGRGALDGLRARMEARFVAPYTNYAPVVATLEFITPTLGCITEPGEQGIAFFPRLKTKMRDPADRSRLIEPGGPMLLGGWIRTALMKAADTGDATVNVDKAGVRRTLPDVAWSHVSISPIVFDADTPIGKSVRRPTNTRGMAVGEIIHESINEQTVRLCMTYPTSHFSDSYLVKLFGQVEATGISAAGMGKGGNWGLVICHSLTVDGREVWPYPTAASVSANGSAKLPAGSPGLATVIEAQTGTDPRELVKAGTVRRINGAGQ